MRSFKIDDVVAGLCAQGLQTVGTINPTALVAMASRRVAPVLKPVAKSATMGSREP